MLVLSRKLGEQICIGDQIRLTVVKTSGKTVRLGIEAPREVRVVRAELGPLAESGGESKSRKATHRRTSIDTPLMDTSPTAVCSERPRGRDAVNCTRRGESCNPARWTVASMQERVRSTCDAMRRGATSGAAG